MYEEYYKKYMENKVALSSLNKLVLANKLTQQQIDKMVSDRKEKYGY